MSSTPLSPIRQHAGIYEAHDPAAEHPEAAWRPILDGGGRPVTRLVHGWQALGLYRGFAPVLLLELRHGGGQEASWFLNAAQDRTGDDLERLQPAALEAIESVAIPALCGLSAALLTGNPPPGPPGSIDPHGLRRLNEATIRRLIARAGDRLMPPPLTVVLERLAPEQQTIVVSGRSLSVAALRACVAPVMQQQHLSVLQGGSYEAICPFTGAMLQTRVTIVDDRTNACRFVSPSGNTFYLCNNPVIDERELFIPILNCTVARRPPELSHLYERLLTRMITHADMLPHYFDRPKRPVNILTGFPGVHIGHFLWNDLSGLERIRRTLLVERPKDYRAQDHREQFGDRPASERPPLERLPGVIVPNAEQGSEIFGPVDQLFPEFAGKVRRLPARDIAGLIYREGLCAMRVYDRRVTRELAGRVGRHARYDPVTGADHPLAAQFEREGRTVILLGLRVHNRTVPEQFRFWIDLVEMLCYRLGRIAVVVDGINSRLNGDPSTGYGTFGPRARRPPVLDELEIAIRLGEHFRDDAVRIVNTVGAPVARSLFWSQECLFFVSFWGAGLAKYRWVANKPGLVLTNRANLRHPDGDLAIYHSPTFMEAPEPLDLIAPEHVTDLQGAGQPDAEGPAEDGDFYGNFTVNAHGVYVAIEHLIARLRPDPALVVAPGEAAPAASDALALSA